MLASLALAAALRLLQSADAIDTLRSSRSLMGAAALPLHGVCTDALKKHKLLTAEEKLKKAPICERGSECRKRNAADKAEYAPWATSGEYDAVDDWPDWCLPCEKGFYSPTKLGEGDLCLKCPEGQSTFSRGSKSRADCYCTNPKEDLVEGQCQTLPKKCLINQYPAVSGKETVCKSCEGMGNLVGDHECYLCDDKMAEVWEKTGPNRNPNRVLGSATTKTGLGMSKSGCECILPGANRQNGKQTFVHVTIGDFKPSASPSATPSAAPAPYVPACVPCLKLEGGKCKETLKGKAVGPAQLSLLKEAAVKGDVKYDLKAGLTVEDVQAMYYTINAKSKQPEFKTPGAPACTDPKNLWGLTAVRNPPPEATEDGFDEPPPDNFIGCKMPPGL